MTTRNTRRVATAALALTVTLALAACGSDEGTSSDPKGGGGGLAAETYDFEAVKVDYPERAENWSAEASSVEIIMSEDLSSVLPEDAAVPVERYVVSSDSLGEGLCRVDVDITYAEGGVEKLENGEDDPTGNLTRTLLKMEPEIITVVEAPPGNDELNLDDVYLTEDYSQLTLAKTCSPDPQAGPLLTLMFENYAVAEIAITENSEYGIFGITWAGKGPDGEWEAPGY